MNQGEALEKWIEEDMRNVPCVMPVDEAGEYMCREAWYAAVKHTLEFVAEELREKGSRVHEPGSLDDRDAPVVRYIATVVLKMKP